MATAPNAAFSNIPENIILEIFRHLPAKELCVSGRVCRSWRRIVNDNSLWRHVDLRPYKLNLHKMWKVIRAHFSDVLLSLHLRGYMDPASASWKKHSLSDAMLCDLQERCPNMKTLDLIKTNMTNVSVTSLPEKLTNLSITFSLIPVGWFQDIGKFLSCLQVVDLNYSSKTSNKDLQELACLSSLETLKINGCYRVTEEGLKSLATGLNKLKALELSETQCTDLALHHICRNLKELRVLDLSLCTKFTKVGLESLTSLPKLTEVNAFKCTIMTDDICTQLQQARMKTFPKSADFTCVRVDPRDKYNIAVG